MKKLLLILGLCIILLSSFVSADLNTNLLSYYSFDSNNATDSTGSKDLTTTQGSPAYTTGKIGNALDLNDASGYKTTTYWQMNNYDTMTVNLWSSIDNTPASPPDQWYFWENSAGANSEMDLGYQTTGLRVDAGTGSGTDRYVVANTSFLNTNWHMITYTINSTHINSYVDGSLIDSRAPVGTPIVNNDNRFSLGYRYATNGQYVDGRIDEFGLWSRALSPDEVSQLYNNGDGFAYPFNAAPNTPSPSLVSVDGTNNTESDLNCSATITDPEGDTMNVTVEWFNNSVLMTSYSLNNNYANGTTVSNIFSSNNFTADNVGDNIICSMRATDGSATSDWGNSTNLTLLEAYNTEPSNVKSYISYNINGELQYDENNASNPVAANSWALNFTADIYSNYSDSLNLVVCSNIADNESDCNVLCSSPSVTNGSVGCLYAPGTTGGFSRTAYAYTNGSWSNYTTIPYYVSSKGGDIPTTYNSSLPFFINTSVSDTITNPYTVSCTSGSTCSYNYTVQITEEAGLGNYTLFAYDSKGTASFNNETFEVLGGVGYGSWTWTNVSVDENIVDRNETFVVTVTAYCQGPYACDYRSGAIHLDP